MRAYILKDDDFERLLLAIDRDPKHGADGGSSQVVSAEERKAMDDAHRFYNYQIQRWLDSVKS